jgi:hypothetical protein
MQSLPSGGLPRRSVAAAVAVFAAALLVASLMSAPPARADAVPNPDVTHIPASVPPGDLSRDYPQLATHVDLAEHGFVEEEFFFEGTAKRYTTPPRQTGSVISEGHPYRTRMLVRRPVSPQQFNGTVVVEWLNVTSGYNLDAMWLTSHPHFLREGYAWVGVSAQRVGVHQPGTGLRSWSPDRYGSLDVTAGGAILDDSLSFDIFSQAAQAISNPSDVAPLGDLAPQRMLASGASQSQGRLVTYYNSIEPQPGTFDFDGHLLYIGTGSLLRTDRDTPAFKVNTENDVIALGEGRARQPDSDVLRTWEVAGTSHVGYDGGLRAEILTRDGLPIAGTDCTRPPFSRVPTSVPTNAAFAHLERWVDDGTLPPTAPLIETTQVTPTVNVVRDEHGNALGGIRLAEHAVPTATNTGVNSGGGFCFLFGSHEPFDDATLRELYRNHGSYVSAVNRVTNDNVRAGYVLQADATTTKRQAAHSDYGKR